MKDNRNTTENAGSHQVHSYALSPFRKILPRHRNDLGVCSLARTGHWFLFSFVAFTLLLFEMFEKKMKMFFVTFDSSVFIYFFLDIKFI